METFLVPPWFHRTAYHPPREPSPSPPPPPDPVPTGAGLLPALSHAHLPPQHHPPAAEPAQATGPRLRTGGLRGGNRSQPGVWAWGSAVGMWVSSGYVGL